MKIPGFGAFKLTDSRIILCDFMLKNVELVSVTNLNWHSLHFSMYKKALSEEAILERSR